MRCLARFLQSLVVKLLPILLCLGGIFNTLKSLGQTYYPLQFQPSTWTYRIPTNPQLNPNSTSYINYLRSKVSGLGMNSGGWSSTIWFADANTPLRTWTYTNTSPSVRAAIAAGGYNLNIPTNPTWRAGSATSSGHIDGFMIIVSADRSTCWDFRAGDVPNLTCDKVRRWSLTSNGIDQPYTGVSARVSPTPLLQGLITWEEMQRGVINHALAYGGPMAKQGGPGVYPCVGPNSGSNTDTYAWQLGYRMQLDPSVNIDSLGLSSTAKIVARALQDYGAIFVINQGVGYATFYAEDLEYDPTRSWGSTFSGLNKIPLDKLRVVQPIMSGSGGQISPPPEVIVTDGTPPPQSEPPSQSGGTGVSPTSMGLIALAVVGGLLVLKN